MKRLRVILLFLLPGAIINVAVAWGCATFVNFYTFYDLGYGDISGPRLTSISGACWNLSRQDYFGSTLLYGDAILEADRMDADLKELHARIIADMPQIPVWSQFTNPPTIQMNVREISRGWPLRTLSWVEKFTTSTSTQQHVWVVQEPPNQIYLPLAPLWTGFAINTISYALLLWMPYIVRRMIRHKRGLCENCAYDLRGAEHEACPECGAEVAKT